MDVKDTILNMARSRDDALGPEVIGRLAGIGDLVAEEAYYHTNCYSSLRNPAAKGKVVK